VALTRCDGDDDALHAAVTSTVVTRHTPSPHMVRVTSNTTQPPLRRHNTSKQNARHHRRTVDSALTCVGCTVMAQGSTSPPSPRRPKDARPHAYTRPSASNASV
jgi:hypothetical protein